MLVEDDSVRLQPAACRRTSLIGFLIKTLMTENVRVRVLLKTLMTSKRAALQEHKQKIPPQQHERNSYPSNRHEVLLIELICER